MDILGKLFSSDALVKIMRLFLLNSEQGFELKDIVSRSKVKTPSAKVEINLLKSIGFIKKKTFYKEVEKKSRSKKVPPQLVKKKVQGWFLNPHFSYLKPLQALLVDTNTLTEDDLANRFKPAGKIKLLVASGIFIRDKNSRIDLLLVGDRLKTKKIDEIVKKLEAELGKELAYAVFDTKEFLYRLEMYDKLISDVLEYPHKKLIAAPELSITLSRNK